jgi:hypothetical protein
MPATPQAASVEWAIRLLAYIGGVLSTIGGSWITSKIHTYHESKNAHLEDIKNNVLVPIRKELESFNPFVFHRMPMFCVTRGNTTYHDNAPVTELPTEEGFLLSAVFPTGWLFRGTEPALTEDVGRSHFPEVTEALNTFVQHWVLYSGECQSWVTRMATEILEGSCLPGFPNLSPNPAAEPGFAPPYVMHYKLAIFVYERLFGLPTSALQVGRLGETGSWAIDGASTTLAQGQKERLEELLEQLNDLLDSQRSVAERLLSQALELQQEFTQVSRLLHFAIASRRLRRRCDLVTFF